MTSALWRVTFLQVARRVDRQIGAGSPTKCPSTDCQRRSVRSNLEGHLAPKAMAPTPFLAAAQRAVNSRKIQLQGRDVRWLGAGQHGSVPHECW